MLFTPAKFWIGAERLPVVADGPKESCRAPSRMKGCCGPFQPSVSDGSCISRTIVQGFGGRGGIERRGGDTSLLTERPMITAFEGSVFGESGLGGVSAAAARPRSATVQMTSQAPLPARYPRSRIAIGVLPPRHDTGTVCLCTVMPDSSQIPCAPRR